MPNKKRVIISAISIFEGGPLTILRDCLQNASEKFKNDEQYEIVAIVHDKKLCNYPSIEYIEIPKARKSWLHRVYFEYVYFKKLSKKFDSYLWFSLHDISPNVDARTRAVYCHNPTPFYKPRFRDIYFNYKVFLFSIFYKFLYKINIKKNKILVVQQSWMRDAFSKMYGFRKDKIIVAYPNERKEYYKVEEGETRGDNNYQFFYPSLSRPFKNFELICEATKIISQQNLKYNFEVILTIDGTEDRYSRWVWNKYRSIKQIKFQGRLSMDQVQKTYQSSNCLIFPSKLETWGLPISEYVPYEKPMLVADLGYGYEASTGAKFVDFFNPNSSEDLAQKMVLLLEGKSDFLHSCPKQNIEQPFTSSWSNLFDKLLEE